MFGAVLPARTSHPSGSRLGATLYESPVPLALVRLVGLELSRDVGLVRQHHPNADHMGAVDLRQVAGQLA